MMNRANRAGDSIIPMERITTMEARLENLRSMGQRLRVDDLKYVLREGQSKGFSHLRKTELQNRLYHILEHYFEQRDFTQIMKFEELIRSRLVAPSIPIPRLGGRPLRAQDQQEGFRYLVTCSFVDCTRKLPSATPRPGINSSGARSTACYSCRFRAIDPFWSIMASILDPTIIPNLQNERSSLYFKSKFNIAGGIHNQSRNGESQLQVLCLLEGDEHPYRCVWPTHAEIRVNSFVFRPHNRMNEIDIKKGRDPIMDITTACHEGTNEIRVSGQDSRAFVVTVRHARGLGVEQVIERWKCTILPKSVQSEETDAKKRKLESKPVHDDDIVEMGSIVSLRCPLSQLRMTTPVRFRSCDHSGSFDLEWFLRSQKSAQSWSCPYCRKLGSVYDIVLDKEVHQILGEIQEQGLDDVDSIEVQADGSWKPHVEKDNRDGCDSPRIKKSENQNKAPNAAHAEARDTMAKATEEAIVIDSDSDEAPTESNVNIEENHGGQALNFATGQPSNSLFYLHDAALLNPYQGTVQRRNEARADQFSFLEEINPSQLRPNARTAAITNTNHDRSPEFHDLDLTLEDLFDNSYFGSQHHDIQVIED